MLIMLTLTPPAPISAGSARVCTTISWMALWFGYCPDTPPDPVFDVMFKPSVFQIRSRVCDPWIDTPAVWPVSDPPMSGRAVTEPGTRLTATFGTRPTGMPSSSSWCSGRSALPDRVSITGALPTTVTSSCCVPIGNFAFTLAVKPVLSAMRSWRTVLNPSSVKVTVYSPGRRSTTWYRPSTAVVVTFSRSISAGLVTATVTPGSVLPESSTTTPTMPPADCAWESAGTKARRLAATSQRSVGHDTCDMAGSFR